MDFRVASYNDNQVVIWDTRNFEKPIVTLAQRSKVLKLAWSATRSGLLCSAEESGQFLNIHDIQSWAYLSEEGEPAVTERSVIAWHALLKQDELASRNIDPLCRTPVTA